MRDTPAPADQKFEKLTDDELLHIAIGCEFTYVLATLPQLTNEGKRQLEGAKTLLPALIQELETRGLDVELADMAVERGSPSMIMSRLYEYHELLEEKVGDVGQEI